jgi:hypothetical protein
MALLIFCQKIVGKEYEILTGGSTFCTQQKYFVISHPTRQNYHLVLNLKGLLLRCLCGKKQLLPQINNRKSQPSLCHPERRTRLRDLGDISESKNVIFIVN